MNYIYLTGNAKTQVLTSTKTMKNQSISVHKSDQNNNCSQLIIRCRYERRFKNTAKLIYQLWQTNILSSQIIEDKLTISSSLNEALKTEMRRESFTNKNNYDEKLQTVKNENQTKTQRDQTRFENEYETHKQQNTN